MPSALSFNFAFYCRYL